MTAQQIDPQLLALNAITMGQVFGLQVDPDGRQAVITIEVSLNLDGLQFCFEHAVVGPVE